LVKVSAGTPSLEEELFVSFWQDIITSAKENMMAILFIPVKINQVLQSCL
jgi:hypothetical protein